VAVNPAPVIQAVIFDFYGTLAPGSTAIQRNASRAGVADALGCDRDRFDAVVRATFTQRATGRAGDPIATLRWLAARCGVEVSDERARAAYAIRLAAERAFMAPRTEALGVLAELHDSQVRVGVLSDCTHELAELWPQLPFAPFVDTAVFSVHTGIRKPAPAMYQRVCTGLRVAPRHCLYVGDGGSNELTGARECGLRAVQLRGPEFAACHTYDAERNWRGEVIADLRDVLDIVQSPLTATRTP
jgi:putative hydrolase of the HAD superfamily